MAVPQGVATRQEDFGYISKIGKLSLMRGSLTSTPFYIGQFTGLARAIKGSNQETFQESNTNPKVGEPSIVDGPPHGPSQYTHFSV